jgi:regulator of cell morphogenesis and NO signaling
MTAADVLDMHSATVADIAVNFPQSIAVLNRHHLDFCCNGGRNFVAVCNDSQLDAESIWREILETAERPESGQRMRFETWDTSLLIDYIVQHHHQYVRESTTLLLELLTKVEAVHSGENPEVIQVRQAFRELSAELLEHMTKEEVIVFPTIRRIAQSEESIDGPMAKSILAPLLEMENEHEEAGRLIKKIRSLTENYTPPLYACPTFQLSWKLLKEFDEDLMQHIHLENNILFPRVQAAG